MDKQGKSIKEENMEDYSAYIVDLDAHVTAEQFNNNKVHSSGKSQKKIQFYFM